MGARVVLGLGGTVDYEIAWDPATLGQLARTYAISDAELSSAVQIHTERDLLISILGFLKEGVGGERFVGTSGVIEGFARHFRKEVTVGGTCVRAAIAMAVVGVDALVHLVCIDDNIRALLPAGCDYICSAARDSTDPHLIVQYGAGASVRGGDINVSAEHPNRLIYTNDPPNRELKLSPELGGALSEADVFMISGLNTIQEETTLASRLHTLREHMQALPPEAIVMYEDAGFHVPHFGIQVREALAGAVDVFSMNEDEMQAHLGRSVDLLDAGALEAALHDLRALAPDPTLVVHSKYWAVAVGSRSQRFAGALDGGVTMATTRFVHGDGFRLDHVRETRSLPRHPGGRRVCEQLGESSDICCVPSHEVNVTNPTMIGLGDTFVGGFVAALADPGSGAARWV
jgi:ADP-dependent phosphofructokinase/glucokinase